MKILILGGYGVFGGRLAELLADIPHLQLLIAGRRLDKAQSFCVRYQRPAPGKAPPAASVFPIALERSDIQEGLLQLKPQLVVDASGPFQDYAANPYCVVSACIAAKIDYMDFADAADFVAKIDQFDDQAQRAGVFVLSGVSSFPVLTAAVLREMAKDMSITRVTGGIAPSPFAGVGLNVMRAVLGYAGSPVKLLRGGVQTHGLGLAESLRYTVAVPGRLPLKNLHFSLVDVPDLRMLPPEHPSMTDIWMGAGPVPEILHRALNVLAKARAVFHLPSLLPWSGLFYAVLNAMKFGEHRGGMFVHVHGTKQGHAVEQSWHLLAEGDDGPYIPSMAIEAILRQIIAGRRPLAGARAATQALELADYEKLFKRRSIFTGFRTEEPSGSIYKNILASAFDALPPRLQELHTGGRKRRWSGNAQVRRGAGVLARMIAALIGFPSAGDDVPVTVTLSPDPSGSGVERWTRDFAGKTFHSLQSCGQGKNHRLLVERFGVFSFGLALVLEQDRLHFVPRTGTLLGLAIPTGLLPNGKSFESQINGQFCFDVEICAPVIGLIVAYKGQLVSND